MIRPLRKWVTARTTQAALHAAPYLSDRALDRLADSLAFAARHLPPLRRIVAANLRSAGIEPQSALAEYFARLGPHFAGAMHAMRCAGRDNARPSLQEIARRYVVLDDSVEALRPLQGRGGAIVVGPHISGYLLYLTRLNEVVPMTIYLRHSKDPIRTRAKERWYAASGVRWISAPPDASGSLGRLGKMASAVRDGHVLFITPDLPQKRDNGVPVQIFHREIYLPAGAGLLAVRTKAPLYMLTAQREGHRQRLALSGAYADEDVGRGRSARQEAVRRRLQWFGDGFEQFVRNEPSLWYLWADKRWTSLWRGDSRYVNAPGEQVRPAAGTLEGR